MAAPPPPDAVAVLHQAAASATLRLALVASAVAFLLLLGALALARWNARPPRAVDPPRPPRESPHAG
jgi:hypothetical protein